MRVHIAGQRSEYEVLIDGEVVCSTELGCTAGENHQPSNTIGAAEAFGGVRDE